MCHASSLIFRQNRHSAIANASLTFHFVGHVIIVSVLVSSNLKVYPILELCYASAHVFFPSFTDHMCSFHFSVTLLIVLLQSIWFIAISTRYFVHCGFVGCGVCFGDQMMFLSFCCILELVLMYVLGILLI